MSENEAEVQQLAQQLVDARTVSEVDLIDKKLTVLRKHMQ